MGARDEQLVTDPALEDDLRILERRARLKREARRSELDDLVAEYESLLDDAMGAEDEDRERALERAESITRTYAETKPQHDSWAALLATVLVVRALRETGDGVPAPAAAEGPVRERLADSDLDDRRIDDYLRAARDALDIDGDPLAWVPEEGLPERTLPQNPHPADDDPTWELPTPEPADEDPVELMEEIADGELDADELDHLDETL